MDEIIEELLQKPYWIIDILPKQVPKDNPGQYFAIENYFLGKRKFLEIKQKHIDLVLKLNCYYKIRIADEDKVNPDPSHLAYEMNRRFLYIMISDGMILSEPDDTHLTLFNPDDELLELVQKLSESEGLYVWQPPE